MARDKALQVRTTPQAARRQDGSPLSIEGLPGTAGDPQTPAAHTHAAADVISGVFALARIAGLTNAQIAVAAAIAYSKLTLTNSVVNADIAAGAAVAYSKLALANSVVNADIAAGAAIAYAKLALTGAVVNADIGAAAAIAYTKLALAGSIVNADVNAAAAIVLSKILTGGEGISGTFTTVDLKTITVTNGIVTSIV